MADAPRDGTETPQGEERPSRRAVIASIAALVAGLAGRPADRADAATPGTPIVLDHDPQKNGMGARTTQIARQTQTATPGPVIEIQSFGGGNGVVIKTGSAAAFLNVTPTGHTMEVALGALGNPAIVAVAGGTVFEADDAFRDAGNLDAGVVVQALRKNITGVAISKGSRPFPAIVTHTALQSFVIDPDATAAYFEHSAGATALEVFGDTVLAGDLRIADDAGDTRPLIQVRQGFFRSGWRTARIDDENILAGDFLGVMLHSNPNRPPVHVREIKVTDGRAVIVLDALAAARIDFTALIVAKREMPAD